MKAIFHGVVLAHADRDDLVRIEGNWYFPPASVNEELFTQSATQYHCPWKGDAKYFHARLEDGEHQDIAWSYPDPLEGAASRVGQDFAGYVAFDPKVEVTD